MCSVLRKYILLEVALQQTLQSLAVTGLVAGHLMDSVMDGIQTVLLGADGQIGLTLSSAELTVNAPCQIGLGVSLHVGLQSLAQQLGKLSSVLSLFIGSLFPVQADLGITLTMSDTSHAQIHTHFRALTLEVSLQLLQDISLILSTDVRIVGNGLFIDAVLMLSSQIHFDLLLHKLGRGNLTNGAGEISSQFFGSVNITANGTDELFHVCFLL